MSFLRISSPFGGKTYPIISAVLADYLIVIVGLLCSWGAEYVLLCDLCASAVILFGAFVLEHRLSPAEHDLIADAQFPVWSPAPPDLQNAVRVKMRPLNLRLLFVLGFAGFLISASFLFFPHPLLHVFCLLVLSAVIFLCDFIRRSNWRTIDDSACCITVPVHHRYAIVRQGKWEERYLVLYLPDGRYILKAPYRSDAPDGVTFVKYHNMYTWLPYYNLHD